MTSVSSFLWEFFVDSTIVVSICLNIFFDIHFAELFFFKQQQQQQQQQETDVTWHAAEKDRPG